MRNGQTTFAIAQAQFAAFGAKVLAGVCVRIATLVGKKLHRLEKRLSYLALRRHHSQSSHRISESRSDWRRCCEWLPVLNASARMCPASNSWQLLPVVGG